MTHLAEVPDVKEVKGIEQFTVAQAELVVAHLEKRPDVLQTQELQDKGERQNNVNEQGYKEVKNSAPLQTTIGQMEGQIS